MGRTECLIMQVIGAQLALPVPSVVNLSQACCAGRVGMPAAGCQVGCEDPGRGMAEGWMGGWRA